MDYLQIAHWDTFQHYKKRNPPWVKLYNDLLDNDRFECLHDDSKLLYFCLLMFASRRENKIKLDLQWLQRKLPLSKVISRDKTLQPLIDAGFITVYQDDSKMIASGKQDAILSRGEERRDRGETDSKTLYGPFVKLTSEEHEKLVEKFGDEGAQDRIDNLNEGIGSKGYKYKSHYFTILSWERKTKKDDVPAQNKTKLFPIPGKVCSTKDCRLPAVYKNDSGAYDTYSCSDHMPESVKVKYA